MSMVAHGYGLAAEASPNLIFSNVLYGHLVRLIPEINGTHGYSIATILVLVIVGTVVVHGLYRLGMGSVGCLSALVLIFSRPVLFPQFTINAGLLMVAAIMCWHLYARQSSISALTFGCLLAFGSYLIRSQECWLVFAVSLPLLPWRSLLSSRDARVAFFALISLTAFAAITDYNAYKGDNWEFFNKNYAVTPSFTDFGAGKLLQQRPDILAQHDYSPNDIALVSSWFFVDPSIINPDTLNTMLDELGPIPAHKNALQNAWAGIIALHKPKILVSAAAALLLTILHPGWRLAITWGLFIASIFTVGLMGRPGVLRVYAPLVSLLLIAPFLQDQISTWRRRLIIGVLLLAAVLNSSKVFSESRAFYFKSEAIRYEFTNFPTTSSIVVWGGAFPFTAIYPVLATSPSQGPHRLYGLGVFTPAPFSVAFMESKAGRDMKTLLTGMDGITVVANRKNFGLLRTYCEEHFKGQLRESPLPQFRRVPISRCRCEPSQINDDLP